MREPMSGPVYASIYPGLCDVAREHGYALAIHGSLVNDLDLIAVPWVEEPRPASPSELEAALRVHLGACGYPPAAYDAGCPDKVKWGKKPHGRVAVNLYLAHGMKVDLSIMPRDSVSDGRG